MQLTVIATLVAAVMCAVENEGVVDRELLRREYMESLTKRRRSGPDRPDKIPRRSGTEGPDGLPGFPAGIGERFNRNSNNLEARRAARMEEIEKRSEQKDV